jgi:hypothetical protein
LIHKKSLFSAIVLLSSLWFLWQTVESTRHRWNFGIVQSKELGNSGARELFVRLPETVAVVSVSSERFSSVKEKDRICVEYSHNSMTKEVAVFSYDISSKCKQKGQV